MQDLFSVGIPILGICYGMQLMNHVNGGKIEKKTTREDGQFVIDIVTVLSLAFAVSVCGHRFTPFLCLGGELPFV
jgi:GMP synthase-like glutamine amidotransferase